MTATLKIENDIAVITMDDGKANAISLVMLDAVNAALDEAEKSASVIILTGRPERFSAGFDLKFLATSAPEDVRRLVNGGGKLAFRRFTSKQPIIIAATGHAIAMGAFDQPTDTHLHKHIYVADKGDYYEIADGLPQSAQ
jgi:enoyl-CoA hydratase